MSKQAQDSMAHCNNARKILAQMNPALQKAQGMQDSRAFELVADAYMSKVLNLNPQIKCQQALHACVHQLYAVNEVGIDQRKDKGPDFMTMAHTQRMIVKIQSKFRQKLTMKKLEKDINVQKQKLEKRANAPQISNEELALKEFKQRLAKKGLTPEGFYRCCDPAYSRRVKVEDFRKMLINFKLNLSRGQVSRLILILDEDMEGTITLEEYYNALEAYGVEAEKHYPLDGTDYYVPFTHRAVFKLITILKDRGISYQELYRSCDVNNDGDVNISELESVLTGFSAEFYQKDTQAIHQFFDIDRNDECSEQEFHQQLEKGERLFTQHKERLAGKATSGKDLRATHGFNDREESGMNAYIPGFNQSSPKTQSEKMTDYLVQTFKTKNMAPSRIYSMADKHHTAEVKFGTILQAMQKFAPSLDDEFLNNVPAAFQMNREDTLSKDEFDMLFNVKASMSRSVGPQASAKKMKNNQMKKSSQDNFAILKYLSECLEKENLTPLRLFKRADKNFNQVLTIDELKECVKELMPDKFAGLNYKKLLGAFDMNQNGFIEQDEFLRLMDMASGSGSNTAQFKKISEAASKGGSGGAGSPSKIKQVADTVKYVETVHAKDRMNSTEVIDWLNKLIEVDNKLNTDDHVETFQRITQKIQKWKDRMGGGSSEKIEDLLTTSLKAKEPVNIHNVKTLYKVLAGLQGEIGLTDVDIMLIIFTSIDQDYMTNLIILQVNFLEWFQIQFDGNSDEEAEFLEDLCDNWASTTTLAMEIVGAYGCLQENHECILTEEWWEKLRYLSFGQQLKEHFDQNQQFKRQVKDLFKQYDNKLSYYDFFDFIEKKMGINDLEKWEKDSLECRLDKLNFAFIEFNEFNEFCDNYKINLGEKIEERDLESIIEEKMNVSYRNYTVTSKDYFRGCKTMLTNEKAALATVSQIYKGLRSKNARTYEDTDFGPNLGEGPNPHDIAGKEEGNQARITLCYSMYKDGAPPEKGYPMPDQIEWVPIQDLVGKKARAKFVSQGISATDCVQGELGDCWLISAMSSIAARDNLLVGGVENMDYGNMVVDKSVAAKCSTGIYPPVFHRYRSRGIYVIRIYKDFNWVYVIIDSRIPVDKKTKVPCFGRCKTALEADAKGPLDPSEIQPTEFWVSLIEKAYAKMHGCYGNLVSGYIDEAIQELTGFQPEKILIRNERNGVFPHKMIVDNYKFGRADASEGFWFYLMERFRDRCIMGCSIKGNGKSGELIIDGHPTGLMLNHAYSLMYVWEIKGGKKKDDLQRLLVLRNPWGQGEWKGAWSDKSEEYLKYQDAIDAEIMELDDEERFGRTGNAKNANDGIFVMHYDDWKENFSTLFVNIDFPEDWTGVRWASSWTKMNSGGLPTNYSDPLRERYANNPQFRITPQKDCEIVVSLAQHGGRLPVGKQYFDYPFAETLKYACLAIFQLDYNEQELQKFDKDKIVYLSPIKRERENSGRCNLKGKMSYIIVPATEVPGITGEFHVSLYHNLLMREMETKRVYKNASEAKQASQNRQKTAGTDLHSLDDILPTAIPEEAEKSANVVPVWKLDLIRSQVRHGFFISDDDEQIRDSGAED